jgi:hypothetical protein
VLKPPGEDSTEDAEADRTCRPRVGESGVIESAENWVMGTLRDCEGENVKYLGLVAQWHEILLTSGDSGMRLTQERGGVDGRSTPASAPLKR